MSTIKTVSQTVRLIKNIKSFSSSNDSSSYCDPWHATDFHGDSFNVGLFVIQIWNQQLLASKDCDNFTMRESQYRWVLYLQHLLIFVDLFVNSFADLLRLDNVTQLVLFIIQDICLIFATIVVFLMFFNTYVFQAGLVGYLVNKFKFTIAILFLYFILCLGLHIWTMTLRWDDVDAYIWNEGFQALYVFQRVGAVFYYYYYKRTALRLGDPRFYKDSAWLRRQFGKVR